MDQAKFGKVAVLFGGTSAEREVSLNSGRAVLAALQGVGVDAHAFDPAESPIADLQGFDRAFIVLHGRGGEDGQIQGLLEWMKLPYTGSGVLASALGMDKARTKQLWRGCDLPTANYHLLDAQTDFTQVAAELGLPVIIKPVHEGSSIGMSKVSTLAEFEPAYRMAAQHDAVVMAERWITGREFTCVILNGQALPVIRLQPPQDAAFYDYQAKYLRNDTTYGIPCGLSAEEEATLQGLALRAFNAVGAIGWGRIDAMQDQDGNFWLLEVNTVPGMTDHSLVPMAAAATGLSFADLCLTILSQTLV
jgi:D-alanine-D-alanine ligase